MKIDVLTLFPEMFEALNHSILLRAQKNNLIEIKVTNIRDFSKDNNKRCDDYSYGGGAGMIMTPQPLYDAINAVKTEKSHVIFMSPKGTLLNQNKVESIANTYSHIIIVCGHYEGIDERIIKLCIDEELSIGDYVLTGGELKEGTNENKIKMVNSEIVKVSDDAATIVLERPARKGSYVYIAQLIDGILSTATRTEQALAAESNTIALTDFHNYKQDSIVGEATFRVFYEYEMGFPTKEEELTEITVLADKFAGTYRFIGDTLLFNQFTGLNDIFQIEIPKLKLDSSFSFNLNAATEAVVFSFKGKALRDDEGQMIKFRQLRVEGKSGDETYGQFDGSFKRVPAKEVTVDSVDASLKDTGVTYPLNENYEVIETTDTPEVDGE